MLEEPQLNGRIASVINKLAKTAGWSAREELRGALRGPKTKPDVLITRIGGSAVVLEIEYAPANTLAEDCMKRLGRDLNPGVAGTSGTVSAVIGIRAPDELHQCDTGDQAQRMLEDGHEIGYAVYQGTADDHDRFPSDGFIKGSIRDLIDFIRPASEPQAVIDAATTAFEQGVEDAAWHMLDAAKLPGYYFGLQIGQELRQPWPAYPATDPASAQEIKQERADQEAREQTAKMAAAIIINALAYHQNLAGFSVSIEIDGECRDHTIRSLADLLEPAGYHPSNILAEWQNILSYNFWAIFDIASKLLGIIPPTVATSGLLERMIDTANSIQDAIQQHDVAGTIFQRLIADRQTLATYYTRPESTTLAAYLSVPGDLDWGDPNTLKNYRIADYACGTGGLVLAAYHRARELHRAQGGDPDELHSHMMKNALTACDIMPAAVHLTSSLLSSVAPRVQYSGTRAVLYLYGATFALKNGEKIVEMNTRGNPRKYTNGDPMYVMDEVHVGSLGLLDINSRTQQAAFPLSAEMAVGSSGTRAPVEIDMPPASEDLVIMNPPFTTPTNHAGDHAKPGNPAFAAFGTTKDEQNAMSAKVKSLGKDTIRDGNAGLGTDFAAIANNMVRPGGNIALVLPASSMFGGIDAGSGASWQKFRRMLADGYNDIVVVSIAQGSASDAAFSADTNLAEVIVVARKLNDGETPDRKAHFVNLVEHPNSKLAAQEVAKSIKRATAKLNQPADYCEISVGEEKVGTVRLEEVDPEDKWSTVRIANLDLLHATEALSKGFLKLPRRLEPITVPISPLGEIGDRGPLHRDIAGGNQETSRGPFTKHDGFDGGTEWPFLWNRKKAVQKSMIVEPDSHGRVKPGRRDEAHRLWERVSHLHISNECAFSGDSTCAVYTEQKSLGARAWPNVKLGNQDEEKMMCVWFNSTLGLMSYWQRSNRSQNGRGGTTVTAIPFIPALDVKRLTDVQLQAGSAIFEDLCGEALLPPSQALRDTVRQELDRRLFKEVLGLDDSTVDQLAILRNQWCAEPTVTG